MNQINIHWNVLRMIIKIEDEDLEEVQEYKYLWEMIKSKKDH